MNPKQIEEFFHLSPVQKHLLGQCEHAAEPSAYLAQFGCYLTGNLDVSAFERAWQKVTNRQPGLRVTFASGDLKEPVQIVNRDVGVELEKQDWRNLAAPDQARRLHDLLQADRQAALALKTPPLWRMTLIRLREERSYFIWTYHKLLFDERSLPLIFNEVLTCYAAIRQGKNETLPLPISFRKYLEWVKKQDAQEAENFWRTYLQGVVSPTSIALTAEPSSARLDVTMMDRLKVLAAEANLSLEVIVQGAWALVLSRLSGQADVVFGGAVSGRPKELHAADRIIGQFSNTLPLRIRVPFEVNVQEYLANIQAQRTAWQQYEHNSLTQIHGWSEFPAEQPLFQSVVVFDAAELESSLREAIAGLEISPERLVLPNEFPLMVMVKEDAKGWQITSKDTSAAQLRFILEEFAHNPQQRLAAIQLPSFVPPEISDEPEPLLDIPTEWIQPTEDEQGWVAWLKSGSCVHELFEEQVARTPDAVAVQLDGFGALTYRELNARANQLARYLHKLNVLPSIPVGLCFATSLEAIVAMLGVLKAGGAYLPLDPQLSPPDLQRILEETAVAILLTQARLEPKFRTIPISHLVLCLDSDWQIIAEEETSNPAFQVSDEHPACFLATAQTPTIISHAQLAQAVAKLKDEQAWFRFETADPWHLFGAMPSTPSAPAERAIPLLDLTPEPTWDTTPLPELELEPWPELQQEFELELNLDVMPERATQAAPENAPPSALLPVAAPKLAPIQQWFFEQHPLEPQHWNLSLLVEISDQLDRDRLELALQTVVAQHEALRWRFTPTETDWQVSEASAKESLPFEYVDFSAKWARSQRKAIEETADQLQHSLNLSKGPLWRVAYFDLGANRAHRLLIIFHHLIGDEASLRIFLEDVLSTYWQIRRNRLPSVPPERATYFQWLQASLTTIRSDALDYWQKSKTASFGALPIDHPNGANTYGQMDRVFVSLNSAETENLLKPVPAAAQAEINEIVLTALALALAQWTAANQLLIEIERNTRRDTLPSLDVSRTIGWFASKFPALLEIESDAEVATALRSIQAQLRAIPDRGLSYGWLRYCGNEATQAALRDLPAPQISFKYLDFVAENLDWHLASESVGNEHHPHNERSTAIRVTGALNLNMLEFQWSYARAQFEQRTIGLLVNGFITELRRLIQHYSQSDAQ